MTIGNDTVGLLREGKKIHDEFKEKMNELYNIEGKTLEEWREEFEFDIPPDPSLPQLRTLLSELNTKIETASRLKGNNDVYYSTMESISDGVFAEAMRDIIREIRESNSSSARLPAKDTLTALANERTAAYKEAMLHSDTARDFFKTTYARLTSQLSIIKNIIIALGIEAKNDLQGEAND